MADKNNDICIAKELAAEAIRCGGQAFYVGGYVRDHVLGIENDDLDIEVHRVPSGRLERLLDGIGRAHAVGESFGIYKIEGCNIDVALPRTEQLIGRGHRDFRIDVDPYVGMETAAKRRDFTINAMYMDVLSGQVHDFNGGLDDLKNGVLRAVSENTFADDALRVLRGAQFCARFKLKPDEKTVELCKKADLTSLAGERIDGELKKALLNAEKPSVFFEFMRNVNGLHYWFPELEALIDCPQNPDYHSEGDVWNHTMLVIDNAAKLRNEAKDPYAFMLSALCHDMGKPKTTKVVDGKIKSIGHEREGLAPASDFLARIVSSKATAKYVLNMIENHMFPGALGHSKSGIKATNKMFDSSVDPVGLINIYKCDMLSSLGGNATDYSDWLKERLSVYDEYMSRPYVMGRDLIELGIKPSGRYTEILDYAHKLRLAGIDKKTALKQVKAFAEKV